MALRLTTYAVGIGVGVGVGVRPTHLLMNLPEHAKPEQHDLKKQKDPSVWQAPPNTLPIRSALKGVARSGRSLLRSKNPSCWSLEMVDNMLIPHYQESTVVQ